MIKNVPSKVMSDAELEAIRAHWREVAFRELVPASLRILEKSAGGVGAHGSQMAAGGKESADDPILAQYERELPILRTIAEEVLKVLQACKGKVGKSISRDEFEDLLERARQRGRQRAAIITRDREAPKPPGACEPK